MIINLLYSNLLTILKIVYKEILVIQLLFMVQKQPVKNISCHQLYKILNNIYYKKSTNYYPTNNPNPQSIADI